jgi:hypothetical protein
MIRVQSGDEMDQGTLAALVGNDIRALRAALERRFTAGETKVTARSLAGVTFVAVILKDRLDVAAEINSYARRRWELGFINGGGGGGGGEGEEERRAQSVMRDA